MQGLAISIEPGSLSYLQSPVLTKQGLDYLDLKWQTNVSSYGYYKVSAYPDKISGETKLVSHADVALNNFEIRIKGIESDNFYYFQAINIIGSDTISSDIKLLSPTSESSGEMEVYFNNPIDSSFSTGEYPVGVGADQLLQAIIDKIDQAKTSIDYCIYNTNMEEIVDALVVAHNRGVEVRLIYNERDETANSAISSSLPFALFERKGNGLMHNKFLIIDSESLDESWIMSGSTNFTFNQMMKDPNHIIFIQDQNLAKAYKIEFNEMWGSEVLVPDLDNAKRGSQKEDNTPHEFEINGQRVELYFSPTDEVSQQISETIVTAESSVDAALLIFTKWDIRDALLAEAAEGTVIRAIVEDVGASGSVVPELQDAQLNILDHDITHQFHHKYAIIDADGMGVDPKLITGSHNWTNSAETKHDENTLIIHSEVIVNLFKQEFEARWSELFTSPTINETVLPLKVYPNPSSEFLRIQIEEPIDELQVFNTSGIRVYDSVDLHASREKLIDLTNWESGLYYLSARYKSGHKSFQSFIKI